MISSVSTEFPHSLWITFADHAFLWTSAPNSPSRQGWYVKKLNPFCPI